MRCEMLAIAAGYEEKLEAAESQLMLSTLDLIKASSDDDEENDGSYILQMQDGVGVIEIRGMLTNINTPWNRYFGVLAYDEIRNATIQALEEGAGSLMYLISSPGGRVSGMNSAAELMSSVPVPTMSYTDDSMHSAAYFLGSQSDSVYAGDFASVGSIGVIATLMDYSEAMKKNGVKAVRFRSGDLKQAGNPMFKLSDKEHKYLQEQVDLYAQKFFNIVSEARGIPLPMLENLDITSGRTFIGAQTQQVGLVDGILSFDQAFAKISDLAKKNIDSRKIRTVF